MGHTFLFRGSPKGRADSIDHWLTMLAGDALLLADYAHGRSLAHLSERLASLAADRSRKGRTKYRAAVQEAVETILAQEEELVSARTPIPLYPSLAAHLKRKARYTLHLVRSAEDMPAVSGAPAMKEGAFCLRLVRETVELCMRYLDPSERTAYMRAGALCGTLDELCARAEVYGEAGGRERGCGALAAEADAAVTAYRELLAEFDSRCREGRLLAVFPPTFLVWADSTAALAHRCLKRLIRGKAIEDIADGLEEDSVSEHVRTEGIPAEVERLPAADSAESAVRAESAAPLVILADDAQETACGAKVQTAEEVEAEQGSDAELEMTDAPTAERIYAKASDYKNVVAKAVQKGREHSAVKPRPLGRR